MKKDDDFPSLRIGVSSCLLGNAVRYDGGHKRDNFVCDVFQRYAHYQPLCPELTIGLGVPRPPIHWININGAVRVRGAKAPELDFTDELYAVADQQHDHLQHLDGYILKSKSPSCGMARVKIHQADQHSGTHRAGAFTERLQQLLPLLPLEEEGRLNDPRLRENFVTRVYVYARWRRLRATGISKAQLIQFHTRHKLLLLAHNEAAYRRMGRMIASPPATLTERYLDDYIAECLCALQRPTNSKRHTNVLQHALGYFRDYLDDGDRHELAQAIDDFRQGVIPLAIPIHLFCHHLRRHPVNYLRDQIYFSPHPYALGLFNAI